MVQDIAGLFPPYLAEAGESVVVLEDLKSCTLGGRPTVVSNLFPLVMKAAVGDIELFTVFGTHCPGPDGSGLRDDVHALDLAAAHLDALDYLRAGGKALTLNIGSGTAVSVLEIIASARQSQPTHPRGCDS